ncbi:MAG TPA: hypothetical protein VG652_09020 [Gaiellaceae bacterium]|nr:hypothetical protein [Gaiellaceae bacterium]
MPVRAAIVVVALAALALPSAAAAHGRTATVALDFRLRLDRSALSIPGVHVRVLDGDRSFQLRVDGGQTVVVKGLVDEPVLRIGPAGVWVNSNSPTAFADKLIAKSNQGWVHVSDAHLFAWHDHRLAPPPASRPGLAGQFVIPITVDGKPDVIDGTFWRVRRPAVWPWLAGAAAFVLAVFAASRRRRLRAALTIALGTAAGLAALAAVTTFAARDAPNGQVAWLQIAAGIGIGIALAALLIRLHGARRVHAAGIVGAIAAAASIGSLSVFWHGVVISALPATPARLACGLALVGGIAAGALSFSRDFDTTRRTAR